MELIPSVSDRTKELQCRRKFLKHFRGGFESAKYLAWERDYKWNAHLEWERLLGRAEHKRLLEEGEYHEIAARAVRIESRTNLLFSFEKMALRDAVREKAGARLFAQGLFDWLYGRAGHEARFERFSATMAELPRRQTRVHTWPALTVWGFLARPDRDIFLKPNVTRAAAEAYGFEFDYRSRPAWPTYASLLSFAERLRQDLADLQPRDLIDLQSFIWVLGSSEYD